MVAINTKKLVLKDTWPGTPNPNLGIPTGGFDATTWTDSSTEEYKIGTKIQVYQDFSGISGMYTMIYLRYYCMSTLWAVEKADLSDVGHCVFQQHCNSTCLSGDGTSAIFTVTNAGTIDTGYTCGTKGGGVAIACGTLSDRDTTTDGANTGGYGWFWIDGVCPMDCTMLAGEADAGVDMSTGGNVAIGEPIYCQVDTSAVELDGATDISANVCGIALATDA